MNRSRQTAMWVFVSAFLFFAIVAPMGHVPSDTDYSIATARSLVHEKSLSLTRTDRLWSFSVTKKGQLHSKYGLGYAVSFIPQVFCADIASGFTSVNPEYVFEFIVSFTNTVYAALIAALFFLLFLRLGYPPAVALAGTLLVSCASILLPYSKIIHAEIPTTLCLMVFLLELAGGQILDIRKGVVLGVCSSALYLLKIGNMPLSCIVGFHALYCAARRKHTAGGLTLFLALAVLPLAGLCALNAHYYGNFLNFGYGDEQTKFSTPLLHGLAGFLFSPSKSIFVFSPLLVLCFAFIKRFAMRNAMVAGYALAIFGTDLLFYALWHDWSGGWCWGPRLIVPAVIVCHVFCAEAIVAVKNSISVRIAMAFLVCASLAINILGTLVWYQQIYYFHHDYVSVRYSHPALAARLLKHKLSGKPEIYTCADFGADCSRPAYHAYWDSIIRGGSIDFTSFEKFRGCATMWTGIADNFGKKQLLAVPFLLFAGSCAAAWRAWRLSRRCCRRQYRFPGKTL
jgi:hypothetical protein